MKFSIQRRTSGQAIVLVLIVLAILGGGYWFLQKSKREREKEAQDFARNTANRLALNFDQKFLDLHLSPEAKLRYPPSFRDRLISYLRGLGAPSRAIELTGTVTFTNQFFEPHGQFRAHLQYPDRSAEVDLAVSSPQALWQIDDINVTWTVVPVPTPIPTPTPVPSPVPSLAEKR